MSDEFVRESTCDAVKTTVFKKFDEIKDEKEKLSKKMDDFYEEMRKLIAERNEKDAFERGKREGEIGVLQKRQMSTKKITVIMVGIVSIFETISRLADKFVR